MSKKPEYRGKFVGQCVHSFERYDTGKRRPWDKPDGQRVWCIVWGKRDKIAWTWDGTDWVTPEAWEASRRELELGPPDRLPDASTSIGNQVLRDHATSVRFEAAEVNGRDKVTRKPARVRGYVEQTGPAGPAREYDVERGEWRPAHRRSGGGRGGGRREPMVVSLKDLFGDDT